MCPSWQHARCLLQMVLTCGSKWNPCQYSNLTKPVGTMLLRSIKLDPATTLGDGSTFAAGHQTAWSGCVAGKGCKSLPDVISIQFVPK